ncbi:beta-lactamase [Croceibacterium mercuriale]|uniref:beta-lactamase n=1 Tax=Croceibacterium mercuriale TaxID=1572751 RepID=A0A0B2BXX1_9SPHN|nr:serine hydrolase [Croceibacterium mercuriale]KHL24852.1 beta-lactamase [Croceibacterium mercuriale]
MQIGTLARTALAAALAFGGLAGGTAIARDAAPPQGAVQLEAAFDTAFGTDIRSPRDYSASYEGILQQQIARLADGGQGRIGLFAVDLATGEEIAVLGDQRFPMASTSKIAIAATFMEGVERGRWSLSSEFPLMVPVASRPFSTAVAPVRAGEHLSARQLIELMITRSSNPATDALLKAVGGPAAVNDWVRRNGISEFNLSRDIATLVRDDGEVDPATSIDTRDSATPRAMVQLLSGLHQGRFLSDSSRRVILGAMERCRTGTRRIRALMPAGVTVSHKTGTLNNTASDIGFIHAPDGRTIAVAIYVTGQGGRPGRDAKIANLARAIYDGYAQQGTLAARQMVNANY